MHERIERLREALSQLPRRQRQALLLRELRGLGQTDIAAELDLSTRGVESLLRRARGGLRSRLRDGNRMLALPWLRALLERTADGEAPGLSTALIGKLAAAPAGAKVAAATVVTVAVGAGTQAIVRPGPTDAARPSSAMGSEPSASTTVARPARQGPTLGSRARRHRGPQGTASGSARTHPDPSDRPAVEGRDSADTTGEGGETQIAQSGAGTGESEEQASNQGPGDDRSTSGEETEGGSSGDLEDDRSGPSSSSSGESTNSGPSSEADGTDSGSSSGPDPSEQLAMSTESTDSSGSDGGGSSSGEGSSSSGSGG